MIVNENTTPTPDELLAEIAGLTAHISFLEKKNLELSDEIKKVSIKNADELNRFIKDANIAGERKFKELADSLPEIVYEMDLNGFLTYVNKKAFEISGYSREDFENGLNAIQFLIPSDRERGRANIAKVLNGGPNENAEYTFLRKNGSTFPILIYSERVITDGRPSGLRGIIIDISERKKTEEELEKRVAERTIELENAAKKLQDEILEREKMQEILKEREEKYRALAENTYDLMAEVDANGKYLYLSPNNKEALGYDFNEIIDHYYYEFIHPEDIERVIATFKKGISSEQRDELTLRFRHKDGHYIWYECTGKTYKTAQGEIRGVMLSRDITQRRKNEEEMLKTSKLESLGILAGGIAHDFNNILMGIIGNLTLAKKRIDKDDKTHEIILRAEKIACKAKTLTEQLITFSKGGLPVKRLSSINDLIKETTKFAITGSSVVCDFNLSEDLYSAELDEGQISQVITNLAINAKQAMSEGGKLTVTTANDEIGEGPNDLLLRSGKYIRITMTDDGHGISEENLGKIFDPYFTTKPTGSGLGLSTCYSIIKNHGGVINVKSASGKGTTFTVYLPAHNEAIPADGDQAGPESSITPGNKKILIMDDDETVLVPIYELLTGAGYFVRLARDGNEAIKLYQKSISAGQKFDLVIMDLVIPGGAGGIETIEKLRAADPDICAVVSSGYSSDPVMANHEKYGFKGVLAKPYHNDELNDIILKLTQPKD